MSRAFAVVLGICFLALGTAILALNGREPWAYRLIGGPLFCFTGMVCLLYGGKRPRN